MDLYYKIEYDDLQFKTTKLVVDGKTKDPKLYLNRNERIMTTEKNVVEKESDHEESSNDNTFSGRERDFTQQNSSVEQAQDKGGFSDPVL